MSKEYIQMELFPLEPNVAAVLCVEYVGDHPYVLLGTRTDTSAKYLYTAPGGKCEEGETIQECARREVFEETGIYKIEDPDEELMEAGPLIRIGGDWLQFFFVIVSSLRPENIEPNKNMGWGWYPLKDLFELVESGNFPNILTPPNVWITVLAEQAELDGIGAESIIPRNLLPRYELFADVVQEV